MTLAAHGLMGAAVGRSVKANLLAIFVLAFMTHWILDAIPHYDYQLGSYQRDYGNHLNDDMVIGVQFVWDVLLVISDIVLGAAVVWVLLVRQHWQVLPGITAGFVGGWLPDIVHFMQMKLKIEPLDTIQRVHDFFHSDINFNSGFWHANFVEVVPIAILILLVTYTHNLWQRHRMNI